MCARAVVVVDVEEVVDEVVRHSEARGVTRADVREGDLSTSRRTSKRRRGLAVWTGPTL